MRIRLTAPAETAQVTADTAARRISGMLLPYGTTGRPSVGPAQITVTADADIQVAEGIVLNLEHDPGRPIGRSIRVAAGDDGLLAEFSIANTTLGSDALVEAAEGLRAGLSIEADNVEGEDRSGVFHITAARITEAALVRRPAFDAATVTHVAATAATNTEQGEPMSEQTAVTEQTAPEVQASEPAPVIPTPTPVLHLSERVTLPTPGEWIIATASKDAVRMADMRRRIQAAAPHTFLNEVPGLLPEAIVGPVVNLANDMAPLYNALGPSQAPAGKSFSIPLVSPNLPSAAAAAEKTDVTEQLGVVPVTVDMVFIKRAVNISAEAVAWTQPSVIDVAVTELAGSLNEGSEAYVAGEVEGAAGTNAAVSIAANGSDAWAKLAAGVAAHYAACGRRPDVFAAAPDLWAKLAGFVNSIGQPLVSGVTQNLTGSFGTLFGIPVVVSPEFTAGSGFLLTRYGVRSWTSGTVEMRVNEPTILGYALGAGRGVGLSIASGKFITPVTVA